jgi:hypothetical protein
MSFIPAVPDSNSSLLPPAKTFSVHMNTVVKNLADKGTMTLIQPNSPATPKLVKRQLPRAKKARARLRQHNKQRAAAAVRTN